MSITNFTNFKDDLADHLSLMAKEIKFLLYKEFKNYIFKLKISSYTEVKENFFTKAFCELSTYCYLQSFESKLLNSKNYLIVKDYLKNSKRKFSKQNFENVVFITATKVSKKDPEIQDVIHKLTDELNVNVTIRNLDWYNNQHFLQYAKLDRKVSYYQEQLIKLIKVYDKELFDNLSNNIFAGTKISYKNEWNQFLTKKIINSLDKFLYTQFNYDELRYQNKLEKLNEVISEDTIYVFLNNVEVKDNYKATLVNDLKFFEIFIKDDSPIFTIDKDNFFSLLKPLSLRNFKNFNELIKYLFKNKKRNPTTELTTDTSKTTDTLNWYWNKILENTDSNEENKDLKKENKNLESDEERDLEKTVTFNAHETLSDLSNDNIFEIQEDTPNDILNENEIQEPINSIVEKPISKDKIERFQNFIKLYEENKNEIELLTDNYDQDKYLNFKESVNKKDIWDLSNFIDNKYDDLVFYLKNKKILKQDLVNYEILYQKTKKCLEENELLK
ncbi:hypothetical protein [Spiroplasma cantharicola]|uniref:Uncharacterized protein n=1 Tax=Spiroplasma cantharicola TaxID=362837 RepID=A0A0M5KE80_9MOLU|nr:hypothetical protein [Spiroplasma cantharicola]ALD66431.1 hypothetical protein SCANT_v1c05250 [Spiroplasma cantharicola]